MSNSLDPKTIKKYFKDQKPPNLSDLQKKHQKFRDPYFPPTLNSLVGKDIHGNFVDTKYGEEKLDEMEGDDPGSTTGKYTWKRASEVSDNWKIFEGKIEMEDINQGQLGDCYFLTACASLSNYPYLIKEKFRTDEYNEECYYEIIMFLDGEWQVVFVDDYFPWSDEIDNFCYAQSHGDELWVMILEKAWAKVNGGYALINGGLVKDPLIAFTGFPSSDYGHLPSQVDQLFDTIEQGTQKNTVMSVGSKPDEEIEEKGLVLGHAYTLLAGKSYETEDEFIDLIKVRNPWGEGEWNGDWSDKSKKWTEELKEYFEVVKKEDGIFWISVDDYVKYFASTSICYLLYGSIIKQFYIENESLFKAPIVFNIHLDETSTMSISVLFKDEKFNRDMHDVKHPFSMVLCQYNHYPEILKVYSNFNYKTDMSIIQELPEGNYALWLYCDYPNVKNDNNFKYVLRFNSLSDFQVEYVGMDDKCKLIQFIATENFKRKNEARIKEAKTYFNGSDSDLNKANLLNEIYYNKSENDWLLIETTTCVFKDVAFLPPFKDMKNLKLKVPPGQALAIIAVGSSFNSNMKMRSNIRVNQLDEDIKYNEVSSLLKKEINEENSQKLGIRSDCYSFVSKDKIKEVPVFTGLEQLNEPVKEDEIIEQYEEEEKKNEEPEEEEEKEEEKEEAEEEQPAVITIEYLKKKYPKEMKILLDYFEPSKKKNIELKIVNTLRGKYVGEIIKGTMVCHGIGIFFWKYVPYITIGVFDNGLPDQTGIIYDRNLKVIYDGDMKKGKKEGKGSFVFEHDYDGKPLEYYEGEFKDDKIEGHGVYHYKNGDTWDGVFTNGKKNGVGVLSSVEEDEEYLAEYKDDILVEEYDLDQEEEEEIKQLKSAPKEKKTKMLKSMNKKKKKAKDKLDEFVDVTPLSYQVEEDPNEKRHRLYLENIDKLREIDNWMVNKLLSFRKPPMEDIDYLFQYVKSNNNQVYMGVYENNKKSGRGVYFNGKNYFVGCFENDKPKGYFHVLNKNKKIISKCPLNPDYSIEGEGTLYFENGDFYKGSIVNATPDGKGTIFYTNGDFWVGNFENGYMNGEGTYYARHGLVSRSQSYLNNVQMHTDEPYVRGRLNEELGEENEIDEEGEQGEAFNEMEMFGITKEMAKKAYKILGTIPPPKKKQQDIYFSTIPYENKIYVGEVLDEEPESRGLMIYKDANPFKFYVGYFHKGKKEGEGYYYDEECNLKCYAIFEKGKRNGYGLEYDGEGQYHGYYKDDKKHGKGVYISNDKMMYVGYYDNGVRHDHGYIINPYDFTKQEVLYRHGEIFESKDPVEYEQKTFKKLVKKQIAEVRKKYPQYEKYIDIILHLGSIPYSDGLQFKVLEEDEGIYIGEVNDIDFKHGRGFYISHFGYPTHIGKYCFNLKEDDGVLISRKNDKEIYSGYFTNDKPLGYGTYNEEESNETIQGMFDATGSGEAEITFEEGKKWKGKFFAWIPDGNGQLFDQNGNYEKDVEFELGKCLIDYDDTGLHNYNGPLAHNGPNEGQIQNGPVSMNAIPKGAKPFHVDY